jgi:peptidoglycan hydrolase-like protein with peptidoglycan-binding domain
MNAAILLGLAGAVGFVLFSGKSSAAGPVPQAIVDRMAAALATGNAATIRLEAASLRKLGYGVQASDLERAASQLDARAAPVAGQPPPQLQAGKPTTLQRGSTGPEVSSWQTFLRAQGYTVVVVDGVFGVQTSDSTKAWQSKRGLKADGIVGPETLRASTTVPPAVAVAAPAAAPVVVKPAPAAVPVKPSVTAQPVPSLPAAPRTLKRGMSGTDVAAWQAFLRAQGYTVVLVDAVFGVQTEDSTRAWQSKRGLKADGIVGAETLRASTLPAPAVVVTSPGLPSGVVKAAPAAVPVPVVKAPTVATPVLSLPAAPRIMQRGSTGADVTAWQTYLRSQGYTVVVVDGVFGVQTSDSTKAWQSKRGLKADGIVGPETLRAALSPAPAALVVAAPVVAAVAKAVALVLPALTRTLLKGASGTDVAAWQAFLRAQGYTAVLADGVFGSQTFDSTKAWQSKAGLKADGIVGPASWAAATAATRVAGDFAFAADTPFSADSPLPGIVPPAAPRLVDVSADRSLAARLALHLHRSEPGSEDRQLVELFQRTMGLNATGAYGPGTAKALIRYGHVPPSPFYWPSQGSVREKKSYRDALLREAARDAQRAPEWSAAASRV